MATKSTHPPTIGLHHDERYGAAMRRLAELQTELSDLERQRDDYMANISGLPGGRDTLRDEARRVIDGEEAVPDKSIREKQLETINGLTHRIKVLREAVQIQRQTVQALRDEIGRAICLDALPTHVANVRNVLKALAGLNAALCKEADLRASLESEGISCSGYLRPMGLPMGTLGDPGSRMSHYFLEACRFGFIGKAELPPNLREFVTWENVAGGAPATAPKADPDGWLLATV